MTNPTYVQPEEQEVNAQAPGQRPQLILPSEEVEFCNTAEALFAGLAEQRRFFARGQLIVELASPNQDGIDQHQRELFQVLEPHALRSRVEPFFSTCRWKSKGNGPRQLSPSRMSYDDARVLLKADAAYTRLPPLATVSACPVYTGEQGCLEILYAGYHAVNGGIYVNAPKRLIRIPPLDEAVKMIKELVDEFEFASSADQGRAIAMHISPALHFGRLLDCDYPADICESDLSQSGKTYRQCTTCAIYKETPKIINQREGGVGSLDESISNALISFRPFILFENFRGRLDSPLFESALRGAGMATARVPYQGEVQVPTGHLNWQISSNGLDSTADLANRIIITRICKRSGFAYRRYPEGFLLEHIKANQLRYLGAVFAVIKEWDRAGRPRSNENRHDFVLWAQTMDWIIQEIFKLPPLLDGHTEEVLRMTEPMLGWVRKIAIALRKEDRLDEALSASELVDLCLASGTLAPAVKATMSFDQHTMLVGRLLGRLFRKSETILIDQFVVHRMATQARRPSTDQAYTQFLYRFERRNGQEGVKT
jgi:hypothetical protein